jgi:hypothetical protein
MDTKKTLKELYSAPIRSDYDTLEEYVEAKDLWIEVNGQAYHQILMAPISEEDGNE